METTFCTLGVESLKNNLFWLYPRFLSSIEFSRVLPWRVPGYNSSTHLTSGEKAFPDIKKFLIRLIRIFSNRIYTTYSMCVPLHKVRYVWTYIQYSMYVHTYSTVSSNIYSVNIYSVCSFNTSIQYIYKYLKM